MARGEFEHEIALVETDLAKVADASMAIADMQLIGRILCRQRWTVALAERYQENIQRIDAGVSVARRLMSSEWRQLIDAKK